MVVFDSKTMNSINAMPDYEEDQYTLFMREPYPYDTIIGTLYEPAAYKLYHFVAARMMPSGHVSNVK